MPTTSLAPETFKTAKVFSILVNPRGVHRIEFLKSLKYEREYSRLHEEYAIKNTLILRSMSTSMVEFTRSAPVDLSF